MNALRMNALMNALTMNALMNALTMNALMNALRMNATQEGIAIFPESSNNSTKTLSFSKRTKSVKYYSASRVKKFSYVLLKHAQ